MHFMFKRIFSINSCTKKIVAGSFCDYFLVIEFKMCALSAKPLLIDMF